MATRHWSRRRSSARCLSHSRSSRAGLAVSQEPLQRTSLAACLELESLRGVFHFRKFSSRKGCPWLSLSPLMGGILRFANTSLSRGTTARLIRRTVQSSMRASLPVQIVRRARGLSRQGQSLSEMAGYCKCPARQEFGVWKNKKAFLGIDLLSR